MYLFCRFTNATFIGLTEEKKKNWVKQILFYLYLFYAALKKKKNKINTNTICATGGLLFSVASCEGTEGEFNSYICTRR